MFVKVLKEVPKGVFLLELFSARLRNAIGDETNRAFADKCSISEGALRNYLKGHTTPDLDTLRKISEVSGYNLGWLASGEGATKRGEGREGAGAPAAGSGELQGQDDRYCSIPLYDVTASAGSGSLVDQENIVDFLHFKTSWVKTTLLASPNDLCLIHVQGDSMIPTLDPGDMLLVDIRHRNSMTIDGIYVLQFDGTLLVKRLQRLLSNTIEITSDNPVYKPMSVRLDDLPTDFTIVGRVVWMGRRV